MPEGNGDSKTICGLKACHWKLNSLNPSGFDSDIHNLNPKTFAIKPLNPLRLMKLMDLRSCLLPLSLGVFLTLSTQAQDLSLYAEPPEGWTYSFNGDAAASEDEASLDGTWSQNNGSDAWDGSIIGEGAPGGAMTLDDGGEAFLRMQDPGDPRSFDFPDPSNRKVSFHRDLRFDGVNAENGGNFSEGFKPLRDGVTLNFRARLPTPSAGGPLDQIHQDGMSDIPAEGDGGTIHDSGKGMFGIHELDTDDPDADKSGKISFSLGLTTDEQNGSPEMDGLIMNSKSGADVTGDVEAGEGLEQNLVAVEDLTQWHEFWITIIRDDSDDEATHKVEVYKDGSIEAETFFVTAGSGQDNESDYLWLSLGATPQSAAVDIDFYRVAEGVVEPSQPSDPNIAVSRASRLGQVATIPPTHQGQIPTTGRSMRRRACWLLERLARSATHSIR